MLKLCAFMFAGTIAEESERAQARIKGLDESAAPQKPKPVKDMNTFINNQYKFTNPTPAPLPVENMKCNVLKEKTMNKGLFKLFI